MYHHLLVPVDETYLSTVLIGKAVEFAHALGARITFFHAQINYTASFFGGGEVVHLSSPDPLSYGQEGRAQELLSKAEAAARARGVACSLARAVSDAPHQAILTAARDAGCDLIYMASHGRRSQLGMLLGSQTLKVVMGSEIAVLVASTKNPSAMEMAVGIIQDEHRALAAVMHAWMRLMQDDLQAGAAPDLGLLRSIVRYIRTFPLAMHHPKEEDFLFRRLRLRTSECNAELDALGAQHARDHALVEALSNTVEQVATGQATLAQLAAQVGEYANFLWDHMGREEAVILPAAQRQLQEEDWLAISAAFAGNQDPRFVAESDAEFKRLYSQIVNQAIAPGLVHPA